MPETSELMKRPKMSDDLVMTRTMELFMPKVIEYLGADWYESEREHVSKQIKDAMRNESDGYVMARRLERDGWAEDRELMELMDTGDHYRRQAYKELTKQWIQTYGIAPARKIGDVVGNTNWHRKGQVGTITKIYEDDANYGVHFPDLPATSAQIFPYEEVIDAPAEAADSNG